MKRFLLILFLVISVQLVGQVKNHLQTDSNSQFDFSSLSWIDAYDSMHATLELRYAFTQWKAINWNSKNLKTRPLIIEAQNANDSVLFMKELIEYLYDVPDGHIKISGNLAKFQSRYWKGTYGFNMIPLDDSSIVVSYIPEGSPAWEAGLRTGDRILKWNGVPIDSVENYELLNYPRNYATIEGRKFSRYLMLGRDSIGATAVVSYQSNTSKQESTISLVAFDDEQELYLKGFFNTGKPLNIDSIVQYKIIENDIGYLFIGAATAGSENPEEIMQHPDFIKVKEAITYFNQHNVTKLIVDLRFNMGGNDIQAAITMGFFYDQPSFYEYVTASSDYNFEVIDELRTEPLTPLFDGEIAVIVDPNCISTGEGIAMMFQRLDNAKIVSHWGTNGSFGMVEYDPIFMPGDLHIQFPQARSLNENHMIQLDSDSSLVGGVMPDVKVPNNVDNIKRQWEQGIDVQLEYAISTLLGIDYLQNNQAFSLYPNPCNDAVNIRFSTTLEISGVFSLFDLNGKLVFQEIIEPWGNNYSIELNKTKPGFYFFEVNTRSQVYRGKLIVD